MRVIVSDGANAGGNNKNPVINSGITTFHLDGVVTLNEKDRYTVNFALKDAGAADFTLVDRKPTVNVWMPDLMQKSSASGCARARHLSADEIGGWRNVQTGLLV